MLCGKKKERVSTVRPPGFYKGLSEKKVRDLEVGRNHPKFSQAEGNIKAVLIRYIYPCFPHLQYTFCKGRILFCLLPLKKKNPEENFFCWMGLR